MLGTTTSFFGVSGDFFSMKFRQLCVRQTLMNPKLSKDRLPHTMVTMVMMLQAEKSFCLLDFKPLYNYMFQEIYIPRFLSNSCGMLGDEYISRQTV